MANIKFSQFSQSTDVANVDFVVGYDGATNVRISPADLVATAGPFLPLAGGTMTGSILLNDNVQLQLGTSADLQFYHDGSQTLMLNNTDNLVFKQAADDKDIIFQSDDGSGGVTTYFKLWGLISSLAVYKDMLFVNDGDGGKLKFGASQDFQIYHDGSDSYLDNQTGNLFIVNKADDKNIIFQSDDGSGGIATYFTVDGANEVTSFQKDSKHEDNIKAYFGNASDLQIYHDGDNSYIKETGTGTLNLQGSTQVLISGTNGEVGVQYVENAGVGLRHNNVTKLTTTSTGVEVSGSATLDSTSNTTLRIQAKNPTAFNDPILEFVTHNEASGASSGKIQLTNGTFNSNDMAFFTETSNSVTEKMRIFSNGSLTLNAYDAANQTGTATYLLGTDANGNVVKTTTVPSGSGGPYLPLAGGTMTGDLLINTTGGYFEVDVSDNSIKHADNTKAKFGTGNNFSIYHNGTDGYLKNETGHLIIPVGNVGIGTTSPSEKLEVNGNIKVIESGENPDVSVFHSDGSYAKLYGNGLFLNRATSYVAPVADNFGSLAVGYNGVRWGNVEINAATVKFENGANEIMRVASSGNVGIGDTAPTEKLTVTGGKVRINKQDEALIINAISNNGSYINFTNTTTPYGYIGAANQVIVAGATTQLGLRSQSDMLFSTGGSTERMRITSAGNVGIGTTSPASKLEVDGGDIEVDDSASGLILRSPDGTRYRVTVANGGTLSVAAV